MLWCFNKTRKYSSAACADGDEIMRAYIEIGNSWCSWRHDLSDSDMRNIGEFTTENILGWLKSKSPFNPYGHEPLMDPSLQLVEFHAVCGDKEVQWETTEPWTPFDGVPVRHGNKPPVVYDTIYPKRVKS
jgi:hypothetical protein